MSFISTRILILSLTFEVYSAISNYYQFTLILFVLSAMNVGELEQEHNILIWRVDQFNKLDWYIRITTIFRGLQGVQIENRLINYTVYCLLLLYSIWNLTYYFGLPGFKWMTNLFYDGLFRVIIFLIVTWILRSLFWEYSSCLVNW